MAWTSAIFVDIRDSSKMMDGKGSKEMSKILKSFSSEILEILNTEKDLVRELGIRGDCVYGIYSTPKDIHEYKIFRLTFWINTCIRMINKLLYRKGYRNFEVGIGFSCGYEFIVKAGRKGTGENDKIWIGDAVHKASNLSNIMNKNIAYPIGANFHNHDYIIAELSRDNPDKNVKDWFTRFRFNGQQYYTCNIKEGDFDSWIDDNC